MSDLIWKIKQLFRKIVPIALILSLAYGGVVLYKKGLFGKKITQQLTSWSHKIPFFGSKFSLKSVGLGKSTPSYTRISKAGKTRSVKRHHGRGRHGKRRHRRHH